MEEIVTSASDGHISTHVGITVCKGPGRYRLLVTRPYQRAGDIVEIPTSSIRSIEPATSSRLGAPASETRG